MIYADIRDLGRYKTLSPNFKKAIDFLQNTTVKRRDGSDETENVLSLTDLNSVLPLDLYIGGNA